MASQTNTSDLIGDAAAERATAAQDARVCRVGQFRPGDLVAGRFDVVRYIARGGMGEVYEVADLHLHRVRLALKTIRPQISGSSGMQDRFEREVLLARRVAHPNLCPIYDIFHAEHKGEPLLFLTMKLVHGETIEDRVERLGKIAPDEALKIVEQVAAALGAAHKAGILHRDVKTSNIMLEQGSDGPIAYVMDFGLARSYKGESTVLTIEGVAGTLGYLAPELLRGALPTVQSDVYAFGVVVFRMLTGQMPGLAMDAAGRGRTEALKISVPAEWRRLVEGCLEARMEKRFQSVAEALDALTGGGSRSRRNTGMPRLAAAMSRRELLVGVAVVVAGGAAVGGWSERQRIAFLFEPLPERRFVALMIWPSSDLPGVLTSVLAAIGSRLARSEKRSRNLLVLTADDKPDPATQLQNPPDAVSALGANLVLAASLAARPDSLVLKLQVLEAATKRVLRQTLVSRYPEEFSSLAEGACVAAAHLLGLSDQETNLKDLDELQGVTAEAYRVFGEAEALMDKPNDAGLQDAILKYQDALKLEPHFALGYARLSMAYTQQFVLSQDHAVLELARRNADAALSNNPASAKGLLSKAMYLMYAGDAGGAFKYFKNALDSDPGNPDTRLYEAQAYRSVGKLSDAETVYRAILRDRPNYWLAYNELGWVLARQANYKDAADAFGAAAAAAPQVALPLANLGAMYLAMGQHDEAVSACNRSLERGPNYAAYTTLGDISFGDGKYQAALNEYQQAAKLDENSHTVWRDIGDCYAVLGNPDGVKKSYAKAAALLSTDLLSSPRSGMRWATLAFYHAKTGDSSAAQTDINQTNAYGGSDVESQFFIVQALMLMGRRDEALQLLLQLLDRGLAPVEVDLAVDLAPLKKDPRYIARVAALKKSNTAFTR